MCPIGMCVLGETLCSPRWLSRSRQRVLNGRSLWLCATWCEARSGACLGYFMGLRAPLVVSCARVCRVCVAQCRAGFASAYILLRFLSSQVKSPTGVLHLHEPGRGQQGKGLDDATSVTMRPSLTMAPCAAAASRVARAGG